MTWKVAATARGLAARASVERLFAESLFVTVALILAAALE
jgi:hypothetical protein